MSILRALAAIFLLCLPPAAAQAPAELEAYLMVARARDSVRRAPSAQALRAFEREARLYLRNHPSGAHVPDVRLWLGDLLKDAKPQEAFREYLLSGMPEAAQRAEDLAFRHEAPPALVVEHWLGMPVDPGRAGGDVTLLAFFSVRHPQTRRILPHLLDLHERFGPRGLRVVGIAAVVDDARNQHPADLMSRLQQEPLPFPVAIDRQRPGERSESLRLYRGEVVPWIVVIDRYGRIAWLGGLTLDANAQALLERTVERLVDEPPLAKLVGRVRGGDMEALARLATLRTLAGATALVQAIEGEVAPHVRERGLEALASLLPEGYLGDDPDAALRRWPGAAAGYRYSFSADRLVAR